MQPEHIKLAAIIIVFAFASNIPLGYFRETTRKFSPSWFFLIHISIPFIIVLRTTLGFNWHWIPVTFALAVAGQLLGGRLRRRKLQ